MTKNSFLIELSESERSMFGRVDFDDQSPAQKVFSAIYGLEGYVNMGGFESYFENAEPAEINFAASALTQIGADNAANIVQRAIDIVSPIPESADARETLLASKATELDPLDESFMAYPDDLTELLFAFVSGHADEFGPVPTID